MKQIAGISFGMLAAGYCLMSLGIGPARSQKPAPAATPLIAYKLGPYGQVGLVALQKAGRIPLTYAADGDTNSTVLRIAGRDVEFGAEGGQWTMKPTAFPRTKEGPQRHGHWGVWVRDRIKVTQVVEILPSHTGKLDTCFIYYLLENTDNVPNEVGLRALIDTQIASNDGNSFEVAGRTVTNTADFKAAARGVPDFISVRETSDARQYGFIAQLTVKVGGAFEAPDRCSLTHWPGPSDEWEVPMENIEEDAAVVMYWNPRRLEAGGRRYVGYAYGQGVYQVGK